MRLKNLINYLLEETDAVGKYWYHTTSPENAKLILQGGLRINPPGEGKSRGSLDWMREAYGGITPIFLSRKPGRYHNGVVLRVDVSGLDLVADIPGLVDFGGRLTEDSIYWDEEETPEELWDLMDPDTEESVNGELSFEWLIEPNNALSRAAIGITDTAAVMEDIGPERIEAMDMIVEGLTAPKNKKLLLLVHPDIVFEPGDTKFIRSYIERLQEHMPKFDHVITHKFYSEAAPELIENIGNNIDLWNELMEVLEAGSDWIKRDYKFSGSFSDALPDYLIENEGTEIWLGGGYKKLCVEDTRKALLRSLSDIIEDTGASIAGCYAPLIITERHSPSFGDSK